MAFLYPAGAFLIGLIFTLALNELGCWRWKSTRAAHWTERAGKIYPMRRSAALNRRLIPVLCFLGYWLAFPDEGKLGIALLVAFAAWLGATLGSYRFDKIVFPQLSFRTWLFSLATAWTRRIGAWAVLIVAAAIMPDQIGWPTFVIAAVVLVIQIGLCYGLWMWIGKKFGIYVLAQDSEPITEIARRTSQRMNVSYRRIWKMRSPVGYAAALTVTRDLIFSEGLLNAHPNEEIAAVCAHELAHLNESPRTHRMRLVSSFGWFPFIFTRPAFHSFNWFGIALLWISSAFLAVPLRGLGRKMEVRADSIASSNQGAAGVYAKALERLYRSNHTPAVMPGDRLTHPHLYDRLLAAGITPDYPRPNPPNELDWTSGLMILLIAILITALLCGRM